MERDGIVVSDHRILIMGLPGSGKTTLSQKLHIALSCSVVFNADIERGKANDWDFSKEGRIRQALRMRKLADEADEKCAIIDMVCALREMRSIVRPHILVWMNTIKEGRYDDTNTAFVYPGIEEPIIYKMRIDNFKDADPELVVLAINEHCNGCKVNLKGEHNG